MHRVFRESLYSYQLQDGEEENSPFKHCDASTTRQHLRFPQVINSSSEQLLIFYELIPKKYKNVIKLSDYQLVNLIVYYGHAACQLTTEQYFDILNRFRIDSDKPDHCIVVYEDVYSRRFTNEVMYFSLALVTRLKYHEHGENRVLVYTQSTAYTLPILLLLGMYMDFCDLSFLATDEIPKFYKNDQKIVFSDNAIEFLKNNNIAFKYFFVDRKRRIIVTDELYAHV